MPFEIYHPDPGQPQRKQGPAKLTVTHFENGRSQISVSAGTRDWLRPTPGEASARYPANMPTMKLLILVDRNARKLMLQRCSDEEIGEHVYVVRGFTGSTTNRSRLLSTSGGKSSCGTTSSRTTATPASSPLSSGSPAGASRST